MNLTKLTKPRARWVTFKLKVAKAVSRSLYDRLLESGISARDFGAVSGSVSDEQQRKNLVALQAALDFVAIAPNPTLILSGTYYINGDTSLKVKTGVTIRNGGITGEMLSSNTLECAALSKPADNANNTSNVRIIDCSIRSRHQSALKGRMYKWHIIRSTFSSPKGKGIWNVADSYVVENFITGNYFYGCKEGIYMTKGTRQPTDQYIQDNYFWAGDGEWRTSKTTDIFMDSGSGSLLSGNHCYGGASVAFMKLVGGTHMRVTGNYFEQNNAATALYIATGNPGTWTINGNSFWCGTYAGLITFELNYRAKVTMSGNTFTQGNNTQLFKVINKTSATSIFFASDNVLDGTFLPNNHESIIIEKPEMFTKYLEDGTNFGIYFDRDTCYTQLNSSKAELIATLYATNDCVSKTILLKNLGTSTASTTKIRFNLGGTAASQGWKILGLKEVPANTVASITLDRVKKLIIIS